MRNRRKLSSPANVHVAGYDNERRAVGNDDGGVIQYVHVEIEATAELRGRNNSGTWRKRLDRCFLTNVGVVGDDDEMEGMEKGGGRRWGLRQNLAECRWKARKWAGTSRWSKPVPTAFPITIKQYYRQHHYVEFAWLKE
jgi:hypothetical protein